MRSHYKHIIYQKKGAIVKLSLNRPEALNAINFELTSELINVFELLRRDDNVKVVILTGTGRAFCTGRDLKEFRKYSATAIEDWEMRQSGRFLYGQLEDFEKPIIAVVNGYALAGGCELAAACDIRFASETAQFGLTEINLGIFPGSGATYLLPRIIGKSRTFRLIFTGDMIDAFEAKSIGLVDEVLPVDQLASSAEELANKIASKSLPALKLAKVAVNQAEGRDIKAGITINAALRALAATAEDHKRGLASFFNKTDPHFHDK